MAARYGKSKASNRTRKRWHEFSLLNSARSSGAGILPAPRCGKMTMDAESVTHNALSRRATVYVCDTCGTEEALEDMLDERMPLTAWAITTAPENWRMAEGGEKHE